MHDLRRIPHHASTLWFDVDLPYIKLFATKIVLRRYPEKPLHGCQVYVFRSSVTSNYARSASQSPPIVGEVLANYFGLLLDDARVRELRSSSSVRLVILDETGTFQHNASRLFNFSPDNIKNCTNYKQTMTLTKEVLYERAHQVWSYLYIVLHSFPFFYLFIH